MKSPHVAVVSASISALNEMMEAEDGMAVNGKLMAYLLGKIKEFSDYGAS